jgi:alcohol dehydrogenase
MTRYGVLRAPGEILFGAGAIAALPRVVASFGANVLLCSDPNILGQPQVKQALAALHAGGASVAVFDGVEPDVPLATIDSCLEVVAGRTVDVVVGVGGGSCIDAAKAVALLLRHPGPLGRYYGESALPGPTVPVVAVPTTAGTGSEVTPVAVVADPARRLKVGISSAQLIPRVALCDPLLTLSCPPSVTAFSGIDALAHAVEAFTSRARPRAWENYPGDIFQGKTTFTDRLALDAVGAIGGALERAVASGGDLEARERMLYGSLCAGLAFGNAGTAGAHALQYPIGASTSTPHGLGVGLLLPYVLRYTREACAAELEEIARALDVDDAIAEIARIAAVVGVPATLAEIGVAEAELPTIAEQAATVTRLVGNSPRPLDEAALLSILREAWHGVSVPAER